MPIQRAGEFLINPHSQSGKPLLGIESDRLDDCVREYQRGQYEGVFASSNWDFDEENLDVLAKLSGLKHIWIWDVDLKNIDGLYEQPQIEYFGVHGKRPPIDFARFPEARTVSIDWRAGDRGLSSLEYVENFYLWHHKPRDMSIASLELPDCSGEVQFNWTNVESFRGLSGLNGVKHLEVHRSRNLVSLEGIQHLAESLKKVIVTTCGKLTDWKALEECPRVELAIIEGERIRG